jgi:hypothetical protein
MAQYTVEDIEILRQKSGISYEEAVNLLEYHNGSLARALVDLEKNGRIRNTRVHDYEYRSGRRRHRHGLFSSLYRLRVKVFKGNIPVINLSALFLIFSLLIASWLVILSAIAALLMGYRFSVEQDDDLFGSATLEDMVRNAGSNIRNTAFTMAKEFGAFNSSKPGEKPAEEPVPQNEPEKRTEPPASGTTPVSVKFSEDGNVHVTEDEEGFHEADIQ